MIVFNDKLFMLGNYNNQTQLMSIDANNSTPTTIYDELNNSDNYIPDIRMTVSGNKLFFWFNDADDNYNLYVSDGTKNGTKVVSSDFKKPRSFSSTPFYNKLTISFNDKLYFRAVLKDDNDIESDLFVSDGTTSGTMKVEIKDLPELNSKPRYLTIINNELYMYGIYSGASWLGLYGLLKLDQNTGKLIAVLDNEQIENEDYGQNLMVYNDSLCFLAGGGNIWITDGISQAYQDVPLSYEDQDLRTSYFISTDGKLFFISSHPNYGQELFVLSNESLINGTIENEIFSKANVFPNPTNKYISFDLGNSKKDLEVYDNMGRLAISKVNILSSKINIESLSDGIYHIIIRQENDLFKGTFVVKH